MKPAPERTRIDGFEIVTLSSSALSASLAPELGGRVVSIRDRRSGREWLDGWEPESSRRLWLPDDPLDYLSGPGAGLDECLPTVLPCRVGDRDLADHGELWSQPAPFEAGAAGRLENHWSLASLPLDFDRGIELTGDQLRFDYRIRNRSDGPTPFQWAWHPLFTLEAGDRIELPSTVRDCRPPGGDPIPWPRPGPGQDLARAEPGGPRPGCAKVFVGPLDPGFAEIRSRRGILRLEWDSRWLPWAGIWINRGVWKDLHHWAIEPTNLAADRLSDAPDGDPATTLGPRETREWSLRLRILAPEDDPTGAGG